MKVIDTAQTADGSELALLRDGDDWLVRVNGRTLMSSRVSDSEEALAEEALARTENAEEVLVGGLGLGFTLRAVLDRVPEQTLVTVAELVPSLVSWNHSHVGGLADHPLDDPRTEVALGNVGDTIRRSSNRFDAILLDVDNGPVALSSPLNSQLYGASGIRACHRALRPYGILAVWSAGESPKFERSLRSGHFAVEVLKVAAREAAHAQHVLFIARRKPARAGATARR